MSTAPIMARCGALDCQVCVPKDWTDERAVAFAEREYPCGTANGWHVVEKGDPALGGHPQRNSCAEREGCVHILMVA